MNEHHAMLNLLLAWVWILSGFISGIGLGVGFHREQWLGGYASLRRRLYRLGHISFFGLGVVNWFFHSTVLWLGQWSSLVSTASWLFIVGALTMPACCLVTAHWPSARRLFAVPVVSLVTGAALTLWTVVDSIGKNSP